jgi:hypothetical protein
MPRDEVELKAMVKKAAQVVNDHPTLKVPEAMRVAKFTLDKSRDRMMQMCVRRLIERTPGTIAISQSPTQTSVSTLISPSIVSGKKTKKICMTSVAAGQKRMNDHAEMMVKKAAHKKTTTMYNSELQKT